MATTKENPFKLVLAEHRLSHVHLKEPKAFKSDDGKEGDAKYSVTYLIKKGHADIKRINEKVKQVYEANKESVLKGIPITSRNFWHPLRDGDEYADENEGYEMYRGHMFIKADSKSQPAVFDTDKQDILDIGEEVKSGYWGRGVLVFAAFNNKSKGVKAFLNSVMKTKEDEVFGGFTANPDDYDDDNGNYDDDDLT